MGICWKPSVFCRWGGTRPLLYLLLGCLWGGCKQDTPGRSAPKANISPLPALAARDAVLYEVFVPGFSAAGTFDGLLPRLDSLRKLGVNTLWLMPLHPTHNSPYAVDDYSAVNRELGDLAAFDRLVAAAHQRGLRVLLDWVANHTSYYHPWIQQHPDWYTRDASGQIAHPNPQWTDVADLNYNRPELRQAMTAAMKTWVTEHAIDGFRCDAADLVPDDYWQAAIAELRQANPNLFFLAEGSQTSHYAAGFQLTFGWDFYTALQRVVINQAPTATLAAAHTAEMQNVPDGSYRLRFTTNHDEVQQGTPAVRFGSEAAARAAYVAMLAFGAAPLVYNGQEAGDPAPLSSTRTPIRWTNDPTAGAFYRGLLRVYNDQSALRYGLAEYLDLAPGAVVVRHRLAGQEVLVLVNLRNSAVSVPLPTVLQGTGWTNSLTKTAVGSPAAVALAAYGYAVWQR